MVLKGLRFRTASVAILMGLVALAGCGTGTTQQGTLYTIKPNKALEAYFPVDLPTVHAAALAAVQEDLGYTTEYSALDAREGLIKGRTAKEYPVRVETFKQGPRTTRIEVYVGGRMSDTAAETLLEKIEIRAVPAQPGPQK